MLADAVVLSARLLTLLCSALCLCAIPVCICSCCALMKKGFLCTPLPSLHMVSLRDPKKKRNGEKQKHWNTKHCSLGAVYSVPLFEQMWMCACVCVCACLCLLPLLVRVPGVLSQTEQETILVSDRGRELVIARERERRRELAEGSEWKIHTAAGPKSPSVFARSPRLQTAGQGQWESAKEMVGKHTC